MRVVKMLVLSGVAALIGCFALVGSAWATPGPLWGFCSDDGGSEEAHCAGGPGAGFTAELLQSGETLLTLVLQLNTQVLEGNTAKETIECRRLHGHGDLAGGDPGTDLETLVYTECTVPNLAGCDVNSLSNGVPQPVGTIVTKPLVSQLVYLTEAAARNLEAATTGQEFKPQVAPTFVELELTALRGGTCAINGRVQVNGELITENAAPTLRLLLKTVIAPSPAKTSYFVDEGGGNVKRVTITRINIGGKNATYSGQISVKVSLLDDFGNWLAFWVCP